jgi:DNA-binding Xre family transcriptional regulator
MTIRWQLKTFLQQHKLTVYSVWKASGISKTTLYAISNGHLDGVQFDTLANLLAGVEHLLKRNVRLEELLEVTRDEPQRKPLEHADKKPT